MNRQERRRLGKRRAFGIAGVSLAAATGLFGSYLGNPRLPRAYAANPPCSGTAPTFTCNVDNETEYKDAVTFINANAAANTSFTVEINSDFVVDEALTRTGSIEGANFNGRAGISITIDGNGHTVSGDPNVTAATFIGVRLAGSGTDALAPDVTVRDLTIDGMRNIGRTLINNENTPAFSIQAGGPHPRGTVTISDVTVTNTTSTTPTSNWTSAAYINAKTVTVSDSAFTNNSIERTTPGGLYGGSGLIVYTSSRAAVGAATISNSTFTDNVATASGNVTGSALHLFNYNYGTPVDIVSSTFTGNRAVSTGVGGEARGAAISTYSTDLDVSGSVFADNVSSAVTRSKGGAIMASSIFGGTVSLNVSASRFTDNEAVVAGGSGATEARGGAIYSRSKVAGTTIESSTFAGNAATDDTGTSTGGAIHLNPTTAGQSLAVVNSTFTGNTSDDSGGAVFAGTAPLSIDFSTITDNGAQTGGGVYSTLDDTITNSIVNLNAATSGADVASGGTTRSQHSILTSASAVSGTFVQGSGTLFSADAQVEPLADNGGTAIGRDGAQVIRTMALKAGALAIDAGSTSVGAQPSFDQRGTGFPRVLNGVPDLGAVEGVSSPPPPPPPPPVFPPSAPRDVTGVAGEGSVAVSWLPPADAGSFPVTDYRVTAGPGGASCLAKAPALTCTVTGLTNGSAYTFVVTALNGAGWGPSSATSDAVTPSPACTPALTLAKGTRQPDGRHDRIRTGGTSACLAEGTRLTPWIRYGDTGEFKEGVASIVVGPQGVYRWTREIRKDKKFTAYVAYEDLESNRVVWTRVR